MAIRCKIRLLGLIGLMTFAGSVAVVAGPSSQPPSSYRVAQLKFNLGLSEKDAKRRLFKKGYRDIRIVRTSFKNVHAEACHKGIRYKIKVRRLSGKVLRDTRIGKCRRPLNAGKITARLKREGFTRISVSPRGREGYVAKACDHDRRVLLEINSFGDVLHREDKGRCHRGPNVAEIKRQLREDGFTRIEVLEKDRGRLLVEACYVDDRMRLRLSPNGHIKRQRVIGTCARPMRTQNIARRLRELGYRQIKVIDDELPVYKAEACRKNELMRIRMNRYGEVLAASRLGPCSPPLNRQQIVSMLQRRGATRVEILSSDSRGFRAAACYKLERRQYRIDLYGTILKREVVGRCASAPRLDSVLEDFRSQGLRDLKIFLEGCRKGRRLQIEIDKYGEEINRERVGRC